MTIEAMKNQLKQLKLLQVPKMSFDDIRYLTDINFSDSEINYINRYLEKFAKKECDNCICCGGKIYQWSIVNGVAECVNCGWECVIVHVIKDENDNNILEFNMPLQYHPDVYEIVDR